MTFFSYEYQVLLELQEIVREWVYKVSLAQGMPEEIASEHGARIYTFGSYRIGVNQPNADIDTLCIAPRNINRSRDFFGLIDPSTQKLPDEELVLYHILRKRPEVSEILAVPESHVPVLKLTFSGVDLDLTCACLQMTSIPPKLDILNDKILRNIDDASQRSCNGVRVAAATLNLVPSIENFRTTLRTIKYWASQRAISANKLGYFGGIQCSLLTARICQLYPNAVPSFLVSRFFRVYSNWKWPMPLLLNNVSQGNPPVGAKVWNPYGPNARDLMPIITPAYPAMNSSFNVSRSTLRAIQDEILRGKEIVDKIYEHVEKTSEKSNDISKNSTTENGDELQQEEITWQMLFAKSEFFSDYKNLLQIDIFADTPAALNKWSGWVESRLRHLIQRLEYCPEIKQIRLFTKGFTGNPNHKKDHCITYFVGLKFATSGDKEGGGRRQVDIGIPVTEWKVHSVEIFRERTMGMGVDLAHVKNVDLPEWIKEQIPPIVKRKKKKKKKRKSKDAKEKGEEEKGAVEKEMQTPDSTGKRRREENGDVDEVKKSRLSEGNDGGSAVAVVSSA